MSLESPISKGTKLKVGSEIYEVLSEEELKYSYTPPAAYAAAASNAVRMTELLPAIGYIYWIQTIGVNGGLSFQIQFPHSVPRNTPTANPAQYYTRRDAHWLDPADISFFITERLEPSLFIINNEAIAQTSIFVFKGLKFKVRKLQPGEVNPSEVIDVVDFATLIQ
jgi:hypothetical protein